MQPTVQVETVAEQVQPRPRDEAGRKDYRVQVVEAESTLLGPSTALVLAPVVEASGAGEPAAVVVAEQTVSAPLATPAPAVQPVPLKVVVTATTTEPTPQPSTPVLGDEFKDANAALRQITDRATAIRDLLQTRQQRLVDVEQQILVLKSQLQQAEARASQLVQELPLGADVTSQAVMLGLLAAVLLIALAATAISALRWNRELQTPVLMMAVQSRRR